jgi:hypothetical protein
VYSITNGSDLATKDSKAKTYQIILWLFRVRLLFRWDVVHLKCNIQ